MRFLLIFLAVAAASSLIWFHTDRKFNIKYDNERRITSDAKTEELKRVHLFASELEEYAEQHHYNTRYCFLVDMKLPCGTNRFFVYDLKNDSVVKSGLVTHGYGSSTATAIRFSNVPGSNCSSLGKYKIGKSYNGRFGLAFKLYGLDSTNSNAFNRFVVLHSHECVPLGEVAPQVICMSQGCPTVSPSFLISLKPYLDNADEPILMKIFY